LFEACARIAALLAATTPAVESACAEYGQALGTAFQVVDDVLDYDGDVSEMGKNLGDDLREGKVTLPLIIAMQRGTQQDRDTLRLAIETGGTDKMAEIVAIVQRTGALDATRNCAAAEAQRAMDALGNLPENDYRAALMSLASQLLERRA
jgi:octaprenyl-diphosphate synthase